MGCPISRPGNCGEFKFDLDVVAVGILCSMIASGVGRAIVVIEKTR
jgi:hypothetical protein